MCYRELLMKVGWEVKFSFSLISLPSLKVCKHETPTDYHGKLLPNNLQLADRFNLQKQKRDFRKISEHISRQKLGNFL